ncbi:MAG: RNA pseudouridine synthase [Leptospira sp.]|nr:RNA pseudouridine synthase [Leptospira sp.]
MANNKYLPNGLNILFEDRDLIVVEKPSGLLTISSEREKSKTVYASLMDYVKNGQRSKNRIFVVHRLDRDTSGILIFAKSEEAKLKLQSNWDQNVKIYYAVSFGIWEKKEGIIASYLTENKAKVVYSTRDKELGKWSETKYKVIKETAKYSLVEVQLLTGRKNQIRVHFADKKHPIVGDKKYGLTQKERFPRMALHAHSIEFMHPFHEKLMFFRSEIPAFLKGLVGGL